MKFVKMHGAGNDFVILNNMDGQLREADYPLLAKKLCARRFSVGADGLMIVVPARQGGDYGMVFFNSDGTPGEMCGNGARCIARYGYEQGLGGIIQRIETAAGPVLGERISEDRYRVRLNDPSVLKSRVPLVIDGREYDISYVELGSPGIPHAVLRLDEWDVLPRAELCSLAQTIRRHPFFPKGANVTFRKKLGEGAYKCLTFERGVEDFTLACGTGAGSTAAAAAVLGENATYPLLLDFPGGRLELTLTLTGDSVKDILLTGPATIVCEGEYIGR